VEEGEAGFLTPTDDGEAFANVMEQLKSNLGMARKLAERG